MSDRSSAAKSSPLRGKYLIQNQWANLLMKWSDALLALWSFKRKKHFLIQPPDKILLSNIAHLGDVILLTSLLPMLKKAFPRAQIGVIVGSWSQSIVSGHPLIDFVHVFDHWKVDRSKLSVFQKMKKSRAIFRSVLKELKNIKYSVVVECNFYFPNTIFLTYLADIPARLGYISGGFGPLLTHPFPWIDQRKSVVEYIRDLIAQFVPIDDSPLKPVLTEEELTVPSLPNRYLVIHMGSGNPSRDWPIEKWKMLCKKLSSDGYFLVFTGKGTRDKESIEAITQEIRNGINLCDRLSLKQCTFLIKHAQMLISVETSLGHVAAATETPTVSIYTGNNSLELWRPLNAKCQVLMHPMPCHPCFLSKGCASMSCVRNVSVDDVYKAAQKVLDPSINVLGNLS